MTTALKDSRGAERLDLVLTRVIEAPRSLVWRAWTEPEHLKQWWAPLPWKIVRCELDLRPGGIFHFVMRSPEGEEYPHTACFLEVVERQRIVWTTALEPGFRPARGKSPGEGLECEELVFTAIVTLEDQAGGTAYTARVLHRDEADLKRHEAMGFHEGWGTCVDQLTKLVRDLKDGAR